MLLVTGIIGASTLAVVAVSSARASAQHLNSVRTYIEQGITSKGLELTENHALALRGLTVDNAFLDMRRLVARAVEKDPDLVYGLYVTNERQTVAFGRRGVRDSAERSPEATVWKDELAIPEAELLVDKVSVKRTQRLGEDVLEVAVPVLGEESEALGTIRYGLSTRRMQEALSRAQADAHARLVHSLSLVAALVGGASILGGLLSRVQAKRITQPVDELTRAAEGLAAGDRAVHVEIDSGDELERLGASFNRMVGDLNASYRELERMNQTLEHKVEERTAELGIKNRDMRLVLDNVDQGFATLSPDGTMGLEHSRVVGEWFGEYDAPRAFADYIGSTSRQFANAFQLAWEQVVEDVLPLEASLAQLPVRLSSQGRSFSFRYLPFFHDQKLEGVLLVIADISERLAKDREEGEQHELMQAFKRLMLDRSGFSAFLREATQMVDTICGRREDSDPASLRRVLHTLKGNAASVGLSVVAGLCHSLEEELAERSATSDATLAELSARWKTIGEHVADVSGVSVQRNIEVPAAEYAALLARLSDGKVEPREVVEQLSTWQLEPVNRAFARLAEQAKALARRLDKGEIQVEVEPNGVRVDPETFGPLFSELVHVVRNAVDHGLETPEERVARHKPREGKLLFKAVQTTTGLTLEIGDDGRGVDWDAIAKTAKERGLPHSTESELLDALCADGVTTRRRATNASGRGVGMAALRQRVERMHGCLEVRSTRGLGTSFSMRFPRSREASAAQRAPATNSKNPSSRSA
ncbi:MAG TPA: HAMP domain-containing protein [Polyangiaceae bacterium]|jgi:HPt (histidine-containing phosphotransfer) domain-containing protein/HAMP domain-containing protein|nr:HAMP domain-containing protein [Polyangiaceae bacterium]